MFISQALLLSSRKRILSNSFQSPKRGAICGPKYAATDKRWFQTKESKDVIDEGYLVLHLSRRG
jgi:hypothetical protein